MTDRSELTETVWRALSSSGSRRRTSDTNEQWLDCRCPLHDDRHRSASLSRDKGTFFCRVCDSEKAIPLERVAAALAVSQPHSGNGHVEPSLTQAKILIGRWSYDYYWPNGELSHRHWRIEYLHHPKEFSYQSPSGEWRRPETYWPIYGDLGATKNSHLIVTEGEKAADSVNVRQLVLGGCEVRALTPGSTQDLRLSAPVLRQLLSDLEPASVTLWPDADQPGRKAMSELQKYLREHGVTAALIDPADYGLGADEDGKHGQDAADFMLRGGDLSLLLASLRRPAAGPSPRDVAAQLSVLRSGGVLLPGTETVAPLDQSWCSSIWQALTGSLPTDRQAKELLGLLRIRGATSPVIDHWRLHHGSGIHTWRPDQGQDCYQIRQGEIFVVGDPPDGVLMTPGRSVVSSAVNLDSDEEPYRRLCDFFGLSDLERALIMAWWVCCLTDRETPIMLMRGAAGTGKSTLASYVLGVVEPTLREIDAGAGRAWADERQLIGALKQVPAVLLDNVSSLPRAMEDVLSRLVTGYSASVMWKYSNQIEVVRMRRGIIMTTTNWEVYKGDLASRIIVCQPKLQEGGWIDREQIDGMFMPLLPAIRGWAFKQASRCVHTDLSSSSFRVASVGQVLASLGYDAADLSRKEARERARILNASDPWIEALVDLWHRENKGGEFLFSMGQIVDSLRLSGIPFDQLPTLTSSKFPHWVEEKQMIMRDHGFWMERVRTEGLRGYWFRRA